MAKDVIASYTVSNTFGMVMYEATDEYVKVAWSDEMEKVLTRKVYHAERPYFIVNNVRFYLDEFMRTGNW